MPEELKQTKLKIIANTGNWIPVIKIALEGAKGVRKAEVDIEHAKVLHDQSKVSVDDLIAIVEKAGKDCIDVS